MLVVSSVLRRAAETVAGKDEPWVVKSVAVWVDLRAE